MKLPSLGQILHASSRTFLRFPFVIINAAFGTASALVLADHEGPPQATILFKILLAAILGIPLLTGFALLAEKRKLGRLAALGTNAFGVLLLVGYAFTVPSELSGAPAIHILRLLVLAVAFLGFVAVAPFSQKGELIGFWYYNKSLLFRFLTAFLFSGVLFAGLAIALASLDNLFGIHVPERRYLELWIFIAGMFTVWFFLAGVPEDLDALKSADDYPKALKIFSQYILFPLVIVYVLILYAYAAKILIDWAWPNGWVSSLILGYAAAGVLASLLLYPIRDRIEFGWVKTFSRWFYVSLLPLTFMLWLAVWKRISEYGVTEQRYMVLAAGVWLALVAAYCIVSKTGNIRLIPGSLALLSLLSSFGPWGLFQVSETSQIGRLKALLERNSILVDGTVRRAQGTVPFEDTKQISSILAYLHDIHGFDRIQPWFPESLKQDSAGTGLAPKDPALVAKMIGVEFVRAWISAGASTMVLTADPEGSVDMTGYDRMLRMERVNTYRGASKGEEIRYRMSSSMDTLTVFRISLGKPADSVHFNIRQLVERIMTDYGHGSVSNIPPEKMSATSGHEGFKVKLCLQNIQVHREDDNVKPVFYDAELLYNAGMNVPSPDSTLH